jgi:hypothetical protein
MAESHRDLRRSKEQVVADVVAQLVLGIGGREIGRRVAPGAALDCHDVEPAGGQFVRENRTGPAQPHNHHVGCGQLACHRRPPLTTFRLLSELTLLGRRC